MDLFDYAQALFNQQGDLWLPGLGHFSKVRKSSYYDADAGVLYPPGYVTWFQENQNNTDTALIAYFSSVKNLSQGSAKYFVDKFVENIKDELQTREVIFASLGTLYTSQNQEIAFKNRELPQIGEGGLYGLPPVSINKMAPIAEPEESPEVLAPADESAIETNVEAFADADTETHTNDPITTAVDSEEVVNDIAPPLKKNYEPRDFYADDRVVVMKGKPSRAEQSNRYQFWILAGLVAVVVLAGIYLVTQNLLDPANSSDMSSQINTVGGGRKDTVVNVSKVKADSVLGRSEVIKTLPATVDTSLKRPVSKIPSTPVKPEATAPLTTEVPKGSWIVAGGQNNNYAAALGTLNKFRSMGYAEARMIDSVKRKQYFVYKIIFGYYGTQKEASQARALIVKENKIKPKVLKVQQYNQ